jgi:undecaprenyl-diphosphatase
MHKKLSSLDLVAYFLLLAFLLLTFIVATRGLVRFDLVITTGLQQLISRKFDWFLSIFSILGTVEVTTLFLLVFLLLIKETHWIWKLLVYGMGLGVEVIGKTFFIHPGPPSVFFRYQLNFLFPSAYIKTDFSYPSGHIFRTAFLITVVWAYLQASPKISRQWKIFFKFVLQVFLGVMIVSRIYLGEHWTSDVLAGLLLGLGLGLKLPFSWL